MFMCYMFSMYVVFEQERRGEKIEKNIDFNMDKNEGEMMAKKSERLFPVLAVCFITYFQLFLTTIGLAITNQQK